MSGFEDKPVLNAKYRNRNEIIASILEAAKGVGISKIRIMFTAYLSYEQLKNQAEEDSNDGNTEQDISEEDGETTTTQEQETDTNFDENSPLLTALLEIKNKLDETLSKY